MKNRRVLKNRIAKDRFEEKKSSILLPLNGLGSVRFLMFLRRLTKAVFI